MGMIEEWCIWKDDTWGGAMPSLYRLDIVVHEEDFALAQALVSCAANAGWEEESLPSGDMLLRFTTKEKHQVDSLAERLCRYIPQARLSGTSIPNQDWAAGWRRYFTPVEAGDFLILPPWLKEQDPKNRIPVIIEPKSAFGTGHHPTTTMCLEALSRLHAAGSIRAGQTFLDMGTGTGILGIACVKMGLRGLGADIDPLSIVNARENCAANHVADAFDLREGSMELVQGQCFDVVMANILAGPLQEMAPHILAAVRPGGSLVLSGFLAVQAPGMLAAYAALGEPARLVQRSPSVDPSLSGKGQQGVDDWVCFFWPKLGE